MPGDIGSTRVGKLWIGATLLSKAWIGGTLFFTSGAIANLIVQVSGSTARVSFGVTGSYESAEVQYSSDNVTWSTGEIIDTVPGGTGYLSTYRTFSPGGVAYFRVRGYPLNAAGGTPGDWVLASSTISANQAPSVTISPASMTLQVGQSATVTGTATDPEEGSLPVTYRSSNTAIATVTSGGVVTVHAVGSCGIIAETQDSYGAADEATCALTTTGITDAPSLYIYPIETCTATGPRWQGQIAVPGGGSLAIGSGRELVLMRGPTQIATYTSTFAGHTDTLPGVGYEGDSLGYSWFYRHASSGSTGPSNAGTLTFSWDNPCAPSPPTDLTIPTVGTTSFAFAFFDASTNEDGLLLEDATQGTQLWSRAASPSTSTINDTATGLTPGSTLRVVAVAHRTINGVVYRSRRSNEITVTMQTLAPVTPTPDLINVSYVTNGVVTNRARVEWVNTANSTGWWYKIRRYDSLGSIADLGTYASNGADTVNQFDNSVPFEDDYYYSIKYVQDAAGSNPRNEESSFTRHIGTSDPGAPGLSVADSSTCFNDAPVYKKTLTCGSTPAGWTLRAEETNSGYSSVIEPLIDSTTQNTAVDESVAAPGGVNYYRAYRYRANSAAPGGYDTTATSTASRSTTTAAPCAPKLGAISASKVGTIASCTCAAGANCESFLVEVYNDGVQVQYYWIDTIPNGGTYSLQDYTGGVAGDVILFHVVACGSDAGGAPFGDVKEASVTLTSSV